VAVIVSTVGVEEVYVTEQLLEFAVTEANVHGLPPNVPLSPT
jgi:hypothetical protein